MKTIYKIFPALAFVILFMAHVMAMAQNQAGIFLSGEDFVRGAVSNRCEKSKVKVHETTHKDIVELRCDDSIMVFKKSEVFGYRDKKGNTFRFYDSHILSIVNPGEPILFYKKKSGVGVKGAPLIITYYFSKDATSPVMQLTLNNIEAAFADNASFLKLLEVHFGDHSNLLEYDNIHKKYKLNRLLELSK